MRGMSPLAAVTAAVLLGSLASCSSDTSSSGTATYDIKASDSACELEQRQVPAGNPVFKVENTGSDVTEVYVYGKDGSEFTKIVGEVENIGPGTTREFTVSLSPGDYEVACKPGMAGDGIRTQLAVTGDASGNSPAANSAGTSDDEPTQSTASGTPSSSTQTPPATPASTTTTTAQQDSAPGRAMHTLVPADKLPGFNPQWTWDQTAALGSRRLPSPCLLSGLESIGAVKDAGRSYASRSGSATDEAAQLTGVFPDEHTALTAVSVLTAWHDKCAASAAAAGLGHVKVSQLRDVPTPVGIGKQWMLSYRPVAGQPRSAGFVSQGFVRDGDTISVLVYRNAGQDYNYEVGHEPIDLGLAVAGHYLAATR